MAFVRALVLLSLAAGCKYQAPADVEGPSPDGATPDPTPDAMACGDADGDGVCDDADQCPDSDDHVDTDGDGVPDGCDTWPCGSEPAAPAASVTSGNTTWGATLSNVSFGGTTRKVATRNTDVSLSFDFSIHDSSCTGNCVDQIEVGLVAGDRQKCPFDQTVQKGQNVTGSKSTTLRLPAAPGVYTVRYGLGENFNCTANNHTTWWLGEPAAAQTIAIVCVP